jgi:plasmid replication initiation protein
MTIKNNLVYQANVLIEASYGLTTKEQQVLFACISQVNSGHEIDANRPYSLTIEQARDLFYDVGARDNAYRDLHAVVERLFSREVRFQHTDDPDDPSKTLTRIVSTIKFDEENKCITMYFAVGILPFIGALKENFSKYRLKHMVRLTSTHAIRLYQHLVMWHGQHKHYQEFDLDEFRELMLVTGKYKQAGQLNEFLIVPLSKQINENTDFSLQITLKKYGGSRGYSHVQLEFSRKDDAVAEDKLIADSKVAADAKRAQKRAAATKRVATANLPAVADKTLKTGQVDFNDGVLSVRRSWLVGQCLPQESTEDVFNRLKARADKGEEFFYQK